MAEESICTELKGVGLKADWVEDHGAAAQQSDPVALRKFPILSLAVCSTPRKLRPMLSCACSAFSPCFTFWPPYY
jgi:hypothetical protein